jgi:hypothetical protein
MRHFAKRLFMAAAPLLLTGCLWGPGKFTSDLTLKKDGSFVLDYRGEIVLQTPPGNDLERAPWDTGLARCYGDGTIEVFGVTPGMSNEPDPDKEVRPCTVAETSKAKAEYEEAGRAQAEQKRKSDEEMAKAFGLPGLDDESNRAFAAKLSKYAGWRSVQYRGNGVFDVDYHMEGRATQDFIFPALPDNDFLIPFIAIRRRADGAVLVTAPSFTGGAGPLAARAGSAAASAAKGGPVSKAAGRFSIITDGEILTNNSEDGASAHALGRQVHWDVSATSSKIPETLIRLR